MLQALFIIKLYHENQMAHVSTSRPQMRSCAGTETCAPPPVSGFHLGGTDRTSAVSSECWKTEPTSRGSHKRHWAMWQTWIAQAAVWLRPLARVVRPHVCRERGGKAILWRDQWVEHGGTRWPPYPPVQAPHVYHVPTFNNKPQHVSHECTGLPNACIWSAFVCLASIRCVWLV